MCQDPAWRWLLCELSTYPWCSTKKEKEGYITRSIELIDVLELESVQRDGLVQNREGASLLQELIQLLVLWHPESILFWTYRPLYRKTWQCEQVLQLLYSLTLNVCWGVPSCFSLSLWSAGIHQTGTGTRRSAWRSLAMNRRKMGWGFTQIGALSMWNVWELFQRYTPVSTTFPSCSRLLWEMRFSRVTAFKRCFRFWKEKQSVRQEENLLTRLPTLNKSPDTEILKLFSLLFMISDSTCRSIIELSYLHTNTFARRSVCQHKYHRHKHAWI